jgi:putative hemolysin
LASVPVPWLRELAEPLAVATVVFTIAYLSLVVGELVPKSLAMRYAETIAMRVARPIEFLGRLSGPVLAVLAASTRLVLRPLGLHGKPPSPFHTLDDLKAFVREAEDQGLVQGELLSGALTFHDRDLRQILTPRNRIEFIGLDMSIEQAMDRVAESGHSRYPVYDGNPENVIGFLYAHDLFAAAQSGQRSDLKTLVRPALIMPAGKPATALLAEMRVSRSQMALIVDEHGSLVGLVTLEDLLEVIVGEIQDEHKVREERMVHLPGGAMEIDGAFPVHELNTDHELGLPESTRYVTIAGLVLQRLGTLPKTGDTLSVPPYTITVIRMQRQRIARVGVHRGPQTERNGP